MELTFKSGVVNQDPIPYEEKNKVQIFLDHGECNNESTWVMLDDESFAKYNSEDAFGPGVGVLLNHTLSGLPWGTYIPIQFNGDQRPTCNVMENFDDSTTFTYADWAAESILECFLQMFQEDKITLEGAKRVFISYLPLVSDSFDASEIHDLMGK